MGSGGRMNYKSLKPGYYLSMTSRLQLWYPKGLFIPGHQTLETYDPRKEMFVMVHYNESMMRVLLAALEFEFIGPL